MPAKSLHELVEITTQKPEHKRSSSTVPYVFKATGSLAIFLYNYIYDSEQAKIKL